MSSETNEQAAADAAALSDAGMCANCTTGAVWTGTPTGVVESIGGLSAYVARPTPPTPASPPPRPNAAILFCHDAFGFTFKNSRLLCDRLCKKSGITVYMPDLFNGDSLGDAEKVASIFQRDTTAEPSIASWIGGFVKGVRFAASIPWFLAFLGRHKPNVTDPLIRNVLIDIAARHGSITECKIGAVGYCWGGRYSLRIGKQYGKRHDGVDAPKVDASAPPTSPSTSQDSAASVPHVAAAVAAHPSSLVPSEDLADTTTPSLFLFAETDFAISATLQKEIESVVKACVDTPSEFVVFKGTEHGFAVRGDVSDAVVAEARDRASTLTAQWFAKYLV